MINSLNLISLCEDYWLKYDSVQNRLQLLFPFVWGVSKYEYLWGLFGGKWGENTVRAIIF